MTRKITYTDYGIFSRQILGSALQNEIKLELLMTNIANVDNNSSDNIITLLSQLNEQNYEIFGKLCEYIMRKEFESKCISSGSVWDLFNSEQNNAQCETYVNQSNDTYGSIRAVTYTEEPKIPKTPELLSDLKSERDSEEYKTFINIIDDEGSHTTGRNGNLKMSQDISKQDEEYLLVQDIFNEAHDDDMYKDYDMSLNKHENSRKRERDDKYEEAITKRQRIEDDNDYNGCSRCLGLVRIMTSLQKRRIEVPYKHKTGECPIYCYICNGQNRILGVCSNIMSHLKYSCLLCNAIYSNHPIERCNKYMKS